MQVAQTGKRTAKRQHILRDITLYILISVAAVSGLFWAILCGVSESVILGSFLFGCFIVFIFGDFVWQSRSVWKDRWFWCGAVFLLFVSFFLLRRFLRGDLNGLALVVLFGVESVIFATFRRSREAAGKKAGPSRAGR